MIMTNHKHPFGKMILAAAGVLTMAHVAIAQPFAYKANDLLLGFRKTGAHQANYELVVNIGQGSNYVGMAAGSIVTVPNYTPAQLTPGAFPDLNFLNWSVLGNPDHSLSGYPNNTIWLTVPRANFATQTTAPQRFSPNAQQSISADISSIFDGAVQDSSLAVSNASFNNTVLVREPINDSYDLTTFVSGRFDTTISTLQDTWIQNVEITTASTFATTSLTNARCDFYEIRPTGQLDPHTGQTSGSAYYVGYFDLATNGVMTFTRSSGIVTPPPPPPAPTLAATRSGNTTTISFGTTNGATYTLYYTNAGGVTKPVATWPSMAGTVTGNGSTKQFTDTTTDTNRFYRVGAH